MRKGARSGTIDVVTGRRRDLLTESDLRNLVGDLCDAAGHAKRPKVVMWTADEERNAKSRDYAYVYPSDWEFHFSKKILAVSDAHREAIVAHEIGHCLAQQRWNSSTEDEADAAAEQGIGVPICYDKAWPGKGLQVVCGRASNPMARDAEIAARLMETI